MQQGRYAARLMAERLRGQTSGQTRGQTIPAFRYRDKGSLATIGRNRAVAMIGRFRFTGYIAWLLWLFIHLLYIVEFESRVMIAIQWGFAYFTFNRGARLITGDSGRTRV
jgi:NADH dehydrogenase